MTGSVRVHPNFSVTSITQLRKHDLAVVKFTSPIPAHIYSPKVADTNYPVDTPLIVTGFGGTGTSCQSGVVRQVAYGRSFIEGYDDGGDFLVEDPRTHCPGDQGGPVFVDDGTLTPTTLLATFTAPSTTRISDLSTTTAANFRWIEAVVSDLREQLGNGEPWSTKQFSGTRGTFFADIDGDRRADAITVGSDIRVRRSSGAHFTGEELWSSEAYFGNVGTFFADVSGDGKADAIVVNTTGPIYVRCSTGAGFGGAVNWTVGNERGNVGTFFADVTGDGTADLIMVYTNGTSVKSSTGFSFAPVTQWSSSFFGSIGTFFADVDGDGRADAIAVNPNGITVRRSNGNAFGALENWTTNDFHGEIGTFFQDINGDGRADAIAVNTNGIAARLSTGSSFGGQVPLLSGGFVGGISTHVADVTGDGRADFIASGGSGMTIRRKRPY